MKFNRVLKVLMIAIIVFIMAFNSCNSYAASVVGDKDFNAIQILLAKMIRNIGFNIFNMVQAGIKQTNNGNIVTIDDLVFDHFEETNINFFNKDLDTSTFIGMLKGEVANWYSEFRKIAILCYLIILLYVGINISLAVGGKKQEQYKEMLVAWGQGLLLLFLFPYFLKFVIDINHTFVGTLEKDTLSALSIVKTDIPGDYDKITNPDASADNEKVAANLDSNPFAGTASNNYMAAQANRATSTQYEGSIADAFVLLIMIFQFILLLIAYYKRIFMCGFLITVFPFVMILYPIDKINDGSAQSFSVWIKEFTLNVFTQTFHALAYVFVLGATHIAANDWILALVGITFLFKADEILKNILGMGGSATVTSPASSMAKAAVVVGAVNRFANTATSTASKLVEGHRMIRESKTMGYRSFVNKFRKDERNEVRYNGVANTFGALASIQGQNTPKPPEEPLQLSPETLGETPGLGDGDADKIAELMADAGNADLYADGSDNLTLAMGVILDNPQNPELAAAYEKQGLTDNGAKSSKEIAKLAEDTQKKILNLDTNDPNYKEEIRKIKKNFTAKIKVAFPNISEAGIEKLTHGMMLALQQGHGSFGSDAVSATLFDIDKTEASFKAKERLIKGKKAVIDFSNVRDRQAANGQKLFADQDQGMNSKYFFGYAKTARDTYMKAIDDGLAGEKLKGLSKKEKEQLADSLAVLSTVRRTSKFSKEEMAANFKARKTKGSIKVTNAKGKTKTFDKNNVAQNFTANTYQEALDVLANLNFKTDGAIDSFVKNGVKPSKKDAQQGVTNVLTIDGDDLGFGASTIELLKIGDEAVMQFVTEDSIDINGDSGLIGVVGDTNEDLLGEPITDELRAERIKDKKRAKQNMARARAIANKRRGLANTKKINKRKASGYKGNGNFNALDEIESSFYTESMNGASIDEVLLLDEQIYEGVKANPNMVLNRQTGERVGYEDPLDFIRQSEYIARSQASAGEAFGPQSENGTQMPGSVGSIPGTTAQGQGWRRQEPVASQYANNGGQQGAQMPGSSGQIPGTAPQSGARGGQSTADRMVNAGGQQGAGGVQMPGSSGQMPGTASQNRNRQPVGGAQAGADINDLINGGARPTVNQPQGAQQVPQGTDEQTMQQPQRTANAVPGQQTLTDDLQSIIGGSGSQQSTNGHQSTADRMMNNATQEEPNLVGYEEMLFNTKVAQIYNERKSKVTGILQDMLDMDEKILTDPNPEPTVKIVDRETGKEKYVTQDEYYEEAKRLRKEGRKKIMEALGEPSKIALAGVTLGPMAIGLNTGATPLEEWAAGTFVGKKALDGMGLADTVTTIKVRGDDGEVYTVDVARYSSEGLAAALATGNTGGVYDISYLRTAGYGNMLSDTNFVLEVERQIRDEQNNQKEKKKADEARAKKDREAAQKVNRFNAAVRNRRNNNS